MALEIAYQINLGIYYFLRILSIALVLYALMSLFVRPTNRFYIFLRTLVSPILTPFRGISRKLMEKGFMLDLSVLMALVCLQLLQNLLPRLVFALFGL